MKIAIAGYGKMGKMVHLLAKGMDNVEVTNIIDPAAGNAEVTAERVTADSIRDADAVIDFSSSQAVMENIRVYARCSATAVIGTTGWLDHLDEVKKLIGGTDARILYSGNFSLGVTLFLMLVQEASRLISNIPSYDVAISEIHHSEKADSPSGTALMAAEKVLSRLERKNEILTGNSEGKIRDNQLQITSMRVGHVPGVHALTIDGPADTITIQHSARNREGFASGALQAALWLMKQDKGLYSMDDFAASLTGGNADV